MTPDPGIIDSVARGGEVLRDGGPWALTVISFAVTGLIARWWREEARGRLQDQKDAGTALAANSAALRDLVESNRVRNDALLKSVESQTLAVQISQQQAALISALGDRMGNLERDLNQLRTTLVYNRAAKP